MVPFYAPFVDMKFCQMRIFFTPPQQTHIAEIGNPTPPLPSGSISVVVQSCFSILTSRYTTELRIDKSFCLLFLQLKEGALLKSV